MGATSRKARPAEGSFRDHATGCGVPSSVATGSQSSRSPENSHSAPVAMPSASQCARTATCPSRLKASMTSECSPGSSHAIARTTDETPRRQRQTRIRVQVDRGCALGRRRKVIAGNACKEPRQASPGAIVLLPCLVVGSGSESHRAIEISARADCQPAAPQHASPDSGPVFRSSS